MGSLPQRPPQTGFTARPREAAPQARLEAKQGSPQHRPAPSAQAADGEPPGGVLPLPLEFNDRTWPAWVSEFSDKRCRCRFCQVRRIRRRMRPQTTTANEIYTLTPFDQEMQPWCLHQGRPGRPIPTLHSTAPGLRFPRGMRPARCWRSQDRAGSPLGATPEDGAAPPSRQAAGAASLSPKRAAGLLCSFCSALFT